MDLLHRFRQRAGLRSRRQLRDAERLRAEEDRLERMVGPPGVWKESQAFQLDFLRTMGLTPEHTVLDIGCGPLRGGIVLIEYLDPEKYVGFDVRPEVVAEAERQIAERGLAARRPTVFVSAGFGRDELGDRSFDVIWVFQVVYHLDDLLVEELFAEIARRLAPTGAAYANVNTRFPPGRWEEFPFVQRSVDFYQEAGRRHALAVEALGVLRDFGYTTKVAGHRNQMLRFTPRQH